MGHLHDRGLTVDLISTGTLLIDAAIEALPAERIGVFELPLLSAEAACGDLCGLDPYLDANRGRARKV